MAPCQCFIKCIICGQRIKYNTNCQCALGEHLIKCHPEVPITHFRLLNDADQIPSDCNCKQTVQTAYKTTVETWASGPIRMFCPRCKCEDSPCIRKQRNKVAYTSLGAIFLLGCWPLCFLPFVGNNRSTIHFYCRQCGKYLGEYNRKTGKLIPPRPCDKNMGLQLSCCQ